MRRVLGILLTLAAAGASACSGNMGTGSGGMMEASGNDAGAMSADSAGVGLPFDAGDFDAGTVHWSDLYAAYFGPSGVANCTAQSICHANAAQAGAASSGFICGTSADSCFAGISVLLTAASNSPGVSGTFLYEALHKFDGTGNMPYRSQYTFQADDLARINAWVESGSPNN